MSIPPVGIKPRWLHEEERIKELLDAIQRYSEAKLPIPTDWIKELKTLLTKEN